ncbi:MAG: efflux RND transporter periplasmic adaptor subunit [Sulfuricurvum sp.]|nr:efflux RND transporter periplasmic adaptor subunit [Sulfuricurvum sp.]
MGKKIGTLVILGLIALFLYQGIRYFYYHSQNAVTDAAFIKSDRLATLSFNVSGNVISLLKKENETVKKGELLGLIDPIDLTTTKEELSYRIQSMDAQIQTLILQRNRLSPSLSLQTSIASKDMDSVSSETAALNHQIKAAWERVHKLSLDEKRYAAMLKDRLIATSEYEAIHLQSVIAQQESASLEAKLSALHATQSKAKNAMALSSLNEKQTSELDQQILSMSGQKKALESSLKDLEHKVGYTRLYAPFDGVIAKKFVDAPSISKQGSPIYALTDPSALYVEVLLSEKELHGIKVGNQAVVHTDGVPNTQYNAQVESISATSASTFSLVPRDIASGEFTKLDQRFIVRLKLENIHDLRAGMGASVAIARD